MSTSRSGSISRPVMTFVAWTLLLSLVACDAAEAPALKIKIADDMSGLIYGNSVSEAAEQKDDLGGAGISWDEAAKIVVRRGRFGKLDAAGVQVSGITLSRGAEDIPGLHRLIIKFPLGEDAAWMRNFFPADDQGRLRATLDVDGEAPKLGETITIEVELPKECHGADLAFRQNGFQAKASGNKASLRVKLAEARKAWGEVHWIITWRDLK